MLHHLSDFIDSNTIIYNSPPSYYYQGYSQAGKLLQLPRTNEAETIAYGLMNYLARDEQYSREGKMYGILLVETPSGEKRVIKAFSGLLNGYSFVEGWVPLIPGRDTVALEEAQTLAQLETIKQQLINLNQIPEREQFNYLSQEFDERLQAMAVTHQKSKQQRDEKRLLLNKSLTGEELIIAIEKLNEESRQDGIERKLLKRQRDEKLQPLRKIIDLADAQLRELKQQRKQLSRQLQAQMHAVYSLTNFLGLSQTLQQLMPLIPTGTGDCCAPKLLHYAASQGLKPLAMAEFWWGQSSVDGDKIQGKFYGACVERCQPLMGFLLEGVENDKNSSSSLPNDSANLHSLSIIYEDEWLIAINKPAKLLSVPGRYRDKQDSVLSRLRNVLPDGMKLMTVHRLDQETSGILLIARDLETYRQLSQQFQQRQVTKIYEAVLAGLINIQQGIIELPLWGNTENRPYQEVNWQHGKPSITNFRVIANQTNYTRVEFIPLTGRTHQLRVHAANTKGLGIPILGDKLYGCNANTTRLHLHARELVFKHPQLSKQISLYSETPF